MREKLIASVSNLLKDERSFSTKVYFILKENDEYTIKLANILDKDEKGMREAFIKELYESVVDNENLSILNLSEIDDRKDALYFYDYKSYSKQLKLIKDFDANKDDDYPKFNFKKDNISKLFGFIISMDNMDEEEPGILLFKKHYNMSLLKSAVFMGHKNNNFKRIEEEDILRLNGTTDIMRVNGDLYIGNIKVLENHMGFKDFLYEAAAESINAIDDLGILESTEPLRAERDNITFIRKLAKIEKTSEVFSKDINVDDIIGFTKHTEPIKGRFKYNDKGNRLVADTKESKKALLSLFNDAFLKSDLTGTYYEANTKDILRSDNGNK